MTAKNDGLPPPEANWEGTVSSENEVWPLPEIEPEPVAHSAQIRTGMVLTALGIVFGDIGTSPLYAFRVALRAGGEVPGPADVIGVLSLIFWSLMLVVSFKYVILVMRADNRGEGGILAMASLLNPWGVTAPPRSGIVVLALAGAAFLVGDAVVTPAISVLSAVEGAAVAAPVLADAVIPATIAILFGLFWIQHRGTKHIGRLFGPLMLGWFLILALMGLRWIVEAPEVLAGFDPSRGVLWFLDHPGVGLAVVGAIFLVVTGGEALYADMGHVGRPAIRFAWFGLVLPALVLNYFGQGALVLRDTDTAANPFFMMAPDGAMGALVLLSTFATIVASQATISGAFSLARQAAQLRVWPAMRVRQTSSDEYGQIYLPAVSRLLAVMTVLLVLGFQTSDDLAGAYGISVSSAMLLTALLLPRVAGEKWRWPPLMIALVCGPLVLIDTLFCGANLLKIGSGGWLPLLIAFSVLAVALIWHKGWARMRERLAAMAEPAPAFARFLDSEKVVRVPGTVVVLARSGLGRAIPPLLVHHVRRDHALHEHVIILHARVEEVPRVRAIDRLTVAMDEAGFFRVTAHYGFMQTPDVPLAVRLCADLGLPVDPEAVTYYVGHETLVTPTGRLSWQAVYAWFARNAAKPTTFFHLPPDRVVEIGIRVEL
jgi:KUP system potassium uptake protein